MSILCMISVKHPRSVSSLAKTGSNSMKKATKDCACSNVKCWHDSRNKVRRCGATRSSSTAMLSCVSDMFVASTTSATLFCRTLALSPADGSCSDSSISSKSDANPRKVPFLRNLGVSYAFVKLTRISLSALVTKFGAKSPLSLPRPSNMTSPPPTKVVLADTNNSELGGTRTRFDRTTRETRLCFPTLSLRSSIGTFSFLSCNSFFPKSIRIP